MIVAASLKRSIRGTLPEWPVASVIKSAFSSDCDIDAINASRHRLWPFVSICAFKRSGVIMCKEPTARRANEHVLSARCIPVLEPCKSSQKQVSCCQVAILLQSPTSGCKPSNQWPIHQAKQSGERSTSCGSGLACAY